MQIKGTSYTWILTPPPGIFDGDITTVSGIIQFLISLLVFGGIFLALLFLIIGGIKLMIGLGDKQATASAKATITYALIGLFLLLASFVIIQLIQGFFDVSLGLPHSSKTK